MSATAISLWPRTAAAMSDVVPSLSIAFTLRFSAANSASTTSLWPSELAAMSGVMPSSFAAAGSAPAATSATVVLTSPRCALWMSGVTMWSSVCSRLAA